MTVPARPVLRLAGFRPNPATGEPVVLLSLQSSEHARLDLFDMSGRQILSKDLRSLGPGEHAVTLGREVSPPPGVYWLRLAQGGRTLTARGLVLR